MRDKVFQRGTAENQPKCARCQLPKENGFHSLTININSKCLEISESYLIEIQNGAKSSNSQTVCVNYY